METTELVLFNKEKIKSVLYDFEFKVKESGKKRLVMDKTGEIAKCHTCSAELTPERVGTIAQGSRLIFCDNPTCFATWVADKKLQ